MYNIVSRINELCERKGWTYYELGNQSGVSQNTIYSWKNKGAIPKIPQLELIEKAFGLTLEQFFCGINAEGLTEEERGLLDKWSLLSEPEKNTVLNLMKTFELLKAGKL